MSTRSERIRLLIEQSNLSYQELEKTTGIKKSSLQRYASGTTAKIPLDVIEKLSKYFNVSQEYLMGWSDDKKTNAPDHALTEGEKTWLKLYHKLSDSTREVIIEAFDSADTLTANQEELTLGLIRLLLQKK